MIEAREITTVYGRKPVLKGFSERFRKGRFTALIGPNGCGKSTLLKAIMGFAPVTTGTIWLDGQPIREMSRRALARRIAYLPQDCQCPDYMTVGELIELAGYARYSVAGGPSSRDRALFRKAIETVGLGDMVGAQVNSLSGGQKQRAWIAMVLAQDTDIILLDEPVNHLDIRYQYSILDLVRQLSTRNGKTVLTVLHDLNLAAGFADDVVMMRQGELLASGEAEATITRENVERVFDLPADVFVRNGRLVCLPGHVPNIAATAQAEAMCG